MKKNFNVLIIEDHRIIAQAYKLVLEEITVENSILNFTIETANNCESGREKINSFCQSNKLDLVLLDISLSPTDDKKILSGVDLGILLRNKKTPVKIIILTSYDDYYRLNSIIKNVDPDGLLLKRDVEMEDIKKAILTVLDNGSFYSETIIKMLRIRAKSEINIDKIDRQILYELSRGVKMKDLPELLPLSMGGIESRKRKLKRAFNILKEKDNVLIEIAREKGFI
tara:strand:+ start:20525 stop:21202 length:678 start_codon:yes stop_codon:yes gene_type:complete